MSYNSHMQERESSSNNNSHLKRKREEENSYSVKKKETGYLGVSKEIGSNPFRWITLQNGDAKAFWYFPSLRYEIDNKKNEFIRSEFFETGNGDKWCLLLWPCKTKSSLGLFVELDIQESQYYYKKSANVYMEAYYTIGNKLERKVSLNFNDKFTFARRDWGYENFIKHLESLSYLNKPAVIEVTVSPCKPHNDSKSVSGYNGIINEGTTCYMNSLLQTLFFLKNFRKAVYLMPTSLNDIDRLPLSLQFVFYNLQFSDTPVSTRDLLTSFGWGADQWNVQHDVQEFNCVLSETLEKKMKGTPSEDVYSKLFIGKMESYIECCQVDYKSTKVETFIDLQLNVKGCENIHKSFEKYIEHEDMTGENKYEAEGMGKQDAKKGVIFELLPPVLQLQLKRFEYDGIADTMVKINCRYEFFDKIDLGKYVKNGGNYNYSLFSILVHKGNATTGHYYSYISPKLDGEWFLFNDDSVEKSLRTQALEGNFGGSTKELVIDEQGFVREVDITNEANAYMLVYIKDDMKDLILQEITPKDIPDQLHAIYKFEEDRKEEEIKSKLSKDSSVVVFLVNHQIIYGWDRPGISPAENDFYMIGKFSELKEYHCDIEMKKNFKGKDLFNKIKDYCKDFFKLWVFTPGCNNWTFRELDLNGLLTKQITNKAVFIESQEEIFYKYAGEWKFIEPNDSPVTQGTEIMDEDYVSSPKVLVIFKWYDWNNGESSMTLIRTESLTKPINILQVLSKVDSVKQGEGKPSNLKIYLEKSTLHEYNGLKLNIESISQDSFQLKLDEYNNHQSGKTLNINSGDALILEIPPEIKPDNYKNAKEWLEEKYSSIIVKCFYFDKYSRFGYESYSSGLMKSINCQDCLLIPTKLFYSQIEFMTQLCTENFGNFGVEYANIQLYTSEPAHNPTPIPFPISDSILNNSIKSLSNILQTNELKFDILPYSIPLIEKNLLVYIIHVDQKFKKITQYHKLVEKNSNFLALDSKLKTEMMEIIKKEGHNKVSYYLLNYPQKAIVKELEMTDRIDNYYNKPSYLLCFRTISKTELQEEDNKVRVN